MVNVGLHPQIHASECSYEDLLTGCKPQKSMSKFFREFGRLLFIVQREVKDDFLTRNLHHFTRFYGSEMKVGLLHRRKGSVYQ